MTSVGNIFKPQGDLVSLPRLLGAILHLFGGPKQFVCMCLEGSSLETSGGNNFKGAQVDMFVISVCNKALQISRGSPFNSFLLSVLPWVPEGWGV